jgi:Zn-dependent M28 family amino/carboxypeptidase
MPLSKASSVSAVMFLGAALAGLPAARLVGPETIISDAVAAEVSNAAASGGAFRHLQALQDIAVANGGNRAAGTAGYDRSAEYVADRLKEAGYLVRFEAFEFPFFEERTAPILAAGAEGERQEAASGSALRTLTNSGSGLVTGRIGAVNLGLELGFAPPPASSSGCEAADFQGFERGSIALIRRGTCTFQVKVDNAVAAGAVGVVIMNEGTDGRKDAFSGQLSKRVTIPVVGVSYELGRSLDAETRNGVSVRLGVDAVSDRRATQNVVAELPAKWHGSLIIVGAHLDSVPEGPGINDNGSGSAAVLEAALRLAPYLAHAPIDVRFAFWGAEERGLIGSRHHVASLSEEERRRIVLYVNLDMVGSANFVRYVQGPARLSDESAATVRREIFADFQEHQLPIEEREAVRTGTDDASFSQKGIPTLGLYTGAGGRKSESQTGLFGGETGRPYDPCYHRACDTIANINREVLEENTRALVRALAAVAMPTSRGSSTTAPAR